MEFINPIFEFSRAMNELQLNDAEFALLIAISIFSAGVRRGRREREQETFTKRGLQTPWAGIVGVEAHVVLLWEMLGVACPYFGGCDLGYGTKTVARLAPLLSW